MAAAAAALLRSVSSKLARARPTHHRQLLARGLHGGAPSGLTGSLSPPACHQRSGERFVMGGAARYLATKLARAPPAPHHQHLHERGLHSRTSPNSSTPPPASKMDLYTALAKMRAGVAYVTLFGSLIYMYGWLLPRLDRLEGKLEARTRESSSRNYNLTQAIEELLTADVSTTTASEAQNMQSSGKLSVGATGNGTKVDKLEEAHCHLKKLEAAIEALQTENNEPKGLEAEIAMLKIALESVHSKGKGNV